MKKGCGQKVNSFWLELGFLCLFLFIASTLLIGFHEVYPTREKAPPYIPSGQIPLEQTTEENYWDQSSLLGKQLLKQR